MQVAHVCHQCGKAILVKAVPETILIKVGSETVDMSITKRYCSIVCLINDIKNTLGDK